MNSLKLGSFGMSVMLTILLSLTSEFASAANDQPMKPEVAAKKENFRKQNEQRVTDSQRKTAADVLKAERLKVYKAKQHIKNAKPETIDTNK